MPRMKSLITRVYVDEAKRSHNCQSNDKHRIERGKIRLKVKNQRSWNHYCMECGKRILQNDIALLEKILNRLNKPPIKQESDSSNKEE